MRRLGLPVAVVAALAAVAPAHARVFHDPCPSAGEWADGQRVDGELLERHIHRYRACGEIRKVPRGQTLQLNGAHCARHFELRGTEGYGDAHRARWDFWAEHGSWVTWTGSGHWIWHRGADGGSIFSGYLPLLHNWNLKDDWPVRVFADCVRSYVPNP